MFKIRGIDMKYELSSKNYYEVTWFDDQKEIWYLFYQAVLINMHPIEKDKWLQIHLVIKDIIKQFIIIVKLVTFIQTFI